ncbi:bleomycin resistance family protein [Micromonospora tulbaghiae]|uniref:Bleomycin resistance protein n=1 Tax=Micromonospora tulbaghiae TaxID=479978 RepID=A0A386WES0_9ACTN|nr:bleomycin resistance family protein [Micromonospora tulbaghiae]NED58462.1 bleomycin resistance family protein [Micromonospora aurantiaca]
MTVTYSNDSAKKLAKLLRNNLSRAGVEIPHSLALEMISQLAGFRDWNALTAVLRSGQERTSPPAMDSAVPVLRVISAEVALRFYTEYLGFTVDWEHRFEPELPIYVQISRSKAVLHLSEHHGDGSLHGVAWFPVADVYALRDELRGHSEIPLRPDVDEESPGGPTLEVIDPYGNVLRFTQLIDS